MNHLTEEDLVLLYYVEPGVGRGAAEHLAECEECRAAAASLTCALDLCDDWAPPEPEPDFGRSAWARLAPALDEGRRSARWWRVPALVGAAALVLVAAFLAGRASQKPEVVVVAGLSESARERILAISLADHFDRAEVLLTEVANASDTTGLRERAQDLVEEGRLMRQVLSGRGEGATLSLMDDVERILTELANGPESVERLRERIGAESLLFKVRIVESNLRTEGRKS